MAKKIDPVMRYVSQLFHEYPHVNIKIVIIGGNSPESRNKNEKRLNKHSYDPK